MRLAHVKEYLIIICEYALAFLVVMDCNSIYANLIDSPYNMQHLALVLSVILVTLLCWYNGIGYGKLVRIVTCPVIYVIMWILFLMVFMKIQPGYTGSYIKYFLLFLPISIILFKIYRHMKKHYQLFYRTSDIVMVLAIMSLVMWLMIAVLGLAEPNIVIRTNWGGVQEVESFFGLYFQRSVQMEHIKFLGVGVYRNIGLYPESPMFNIVLILSFYTELFLREKIKYGRLSLLSLTIISTFSILGMIFSFGGLCLKAVWTLWNKKKRKVIVVGILAVLLIFLRILIGYKRIYGSGSYSMHIDDLLSCIRAWAVTPIFGNGFENYDLIYENMSQFRKESTGLTTSAGVVLAQGGLGLLGLYLFPFIMGGVKNWRESKREVAWWALGVLGLFLTFIFTYRFLMLWLLAFAYSWIGDKQEELRNGSI